MTSTSSNSNSNSSNSSSGGFALHRYLLTLLVGFVVGQCLSSRSWYDNVDNVDNKDRTTITKTTAKTTSTTQEERLADGCFHVFLDVGANIGVHGRFLFEANKYPDAVVAQGFFQSQLGPPVVRDNRDLCVFAFEPNPNHHARLDKVSQAYQAMGWRYHVVKAGVSDQAQQIHFYPRNDKHFSEWGFSAIKVEQGMNGLADSGPVTVPVIALAQWIQQHVQGRQLPDVVYGNYNTTTTKQPKVLIKMDIEGMEYRVIPDLLVSGVFCNAIDAIFGEVHNQFFPQTLANGKVLQQAQGLQYWQHVMLAWQVNPHCRGQWIPGDDEHYLLDGMELPTPTTTTHDD